MISCVGEGLPIEGQSEIQQWWRQESRHEGLQTHDASVGDTAHDSHVAQAEVTVLGEQVLVLQAHQYSVLAQLVAASLEGLVIRDQGIA